jgi:sialate O-acetylesterase
MNKSPFRNHVCCLIIFLSTFFSLFATTSTKETQTKINWESTTIYQLELPKFMSSNMVVQRDVPMHFWGWANVGEQVKVTFTRNGNSISNTTTVNKNGKWSVLLDAQTVESTACTLRFELVNQPETVQTLTNILVGDVWLASGQSNMEKKVSHLLEATQVIAEADNYPLIRSFRASYNAKSQPQEKVNSSSLPWFVCNSLEVGNNVSAVAYIFAREIYKSQKIPIGILQSYRGGTELETWMSRTKIDTDNELCKVAGRIGTMDSTNANNYPSINFNGQVNPLVGFPIKGFIFYQGESNTKRALEYRLMMKKLIENWRSLWQMGDLPFYYVQLFNMGISTNQLYEEGNWQDIREQQEQLLTVENIPNIGMAVTIDTNEDPNNVDDLIRIHPKNKLPVGERLAQVVLKRTYNMNIVGESPLLSHFRISNDTAFLVFKNVGNGLKIKSGDTELKGFAMSGADKIFKSANAGIENDSTIIVKCNTITTPVSIRYGWSKNPICNLYNSADLPASPFRTDIWKSGYAYAANSSTCTASNDATLIGIRTNGTKLMDFSTEKLHYELKSAYIRQVTAYANSPFATVTLEQATIQNGRKATISVQAEDKTLRVYEVHFDNKTNTREINKDNFKITQQDKKLIIDVNSDMNGTFKIFNSFGQSIHNKQFNGNSCHQFSVNNAGIYLARLNTVGSDYSLKFIIK